MKMPFCTANAAETKFVVTMNARAFAFSACDANRAQWEIRILATEMLRQVKEIAPNLFKNAGPGCVRGKCPEGKMTCGKANEVRDNFLKM